MEREMSQEDGSNNSNETTQIEPSQPSSNLSKLELLPQEVFNNICINLNPKDVMCLSRISRVLRQRTDSSNNHIWFLIFRKCQDNFNLMDRDGPYHPEYIYKRLVQRNLNRKVATCDYCGENELDMLSRLIIPNRYSPRDLPTFGRAPSSCSMRAHLGMICSVCLPKNFVPVDDFAIFSETGLPDMSGSDKRLLEVLRVQHLEGVINLIPSQDLRQGSKERSDVCFHWISEPDWQLAKLRRRMNPFYLPKRDIQDLVKTHKGFLSTDPRDYATLIFAAIQTLYESEYTLCHEHIKPIDLKAALWALKIIDQSHQIRQMSREQWDKHFFTTNTDPICEQKAIMQFAVRFLQGAFGDGDGVPLRSSAISRDRPAVVLGQIVLSGMDAILDKSTWRKPS